jgi:hypothetical protein
MKYLKKFENMIMNEYQLNEHSSIMVKYLYNINNVLHYISKLDEPSDHDKYPNILMKHLNIGPEQITAMEPRYYEIEKENSVDNDNALVISNEDLIDFKYLLDSSLKEEDIIKYLNDGPFYNGKYKKLDGFHIWIW